MPSVASMEAMTWIAAVYSLVLLGVAYGIDILARNASKAMELRHNPGFDYHEENDAYTCPEDEWLWPKSYDPGNRVMRYQAPASVCNNCLKVTTCTSGGGGREIQRHLDPWPASESARFHRGIACTVTVLAVVWPIAALLSIPPALDTIVLSLVLVVVVGFALPLWKFLRRSPVDPTGVLLRNADANVLAREREAAAFAARTSTYWSEKRLAAERLAATGAQLRAQRAELAKVNQKIAKEASKDARRLARISSNGSHCDTEPQQPRMSRSERKAAQKQAELEQIGSFE